MKRRFAFFAFITLLQGASVQADDAPAAAPSGPALSGNLSGVSDYLFRGLSQTSQDPALQGGFEYGSADSWYVGAWASNVSWLSDLSSPDFPISNSLEVDVYAGWRIPFNDSWKLDIGAYTYYYPGDYAHGITRPYTTEGYVGLLWSFFSLKYSHAFTNTFGFADSSHSDYLDLSGNVSVRPSHLPPPRKPCSDPCSLTSRSAVCRASGRCGRSEWRRGE